ncbi:acyl-CoA dehydrogenase family protein [Amycolatopsis sp. CA-230715]|uniref:acyl-CoA dehydrogenase family protein n=1 Tax=Amycolatopsis sp. CA-230715 TaxID=2745196 RepID=UPI001C009524|nr:acyl-CoA dehydrogenase family protein [Amycolatopsis sp. CA-230715]QWF76791.1 Cyclohexane-1-carbonyl-CoA dehydrogenase [Amycolatopsis sp. CA-230715]
MEPDELLGRVDEIVAAGITPELAAEHERGETYPLELVRRLCELGLPALVTERPHRTELFCRAVERVATAWVAPAESVHLQALATCALARHGSPELREEFLARLRQGRVIAGNCLSEPGAGSDLALIATTAEPDGDGYRLNGVKAWVGHAGVAGLLNVYARTGGGGLGGITCFLVDTASPGVEVRRAEDKMGVRALPTAQIAFHDVRVPAGRVVGRVNRGMVAAQSFFVQGRLGIAACAIGLAEAALTRAVTHARTREQFGAPVITFQGVGFLLADASIEIEASRQLLHHACREVDVGGGRSELLAAQAKVLATDTAMKVTANAVQVLGARGYTGAEPVERWMREAKLFQIIEGTNQIQRAAIASRL